MMFALVVTGFSGVPRMPRSQKQRIALDMNKKVVIVGGTGYIGKYVVKESVKRGYATTVVLRPGAVEKKDFFAGAKLVYADVCDEGSLINVLTEPVDAVISCLASSKSMLKQKRSYKNHDCNRFYRIWCQG